MTCENFPVAVALPPGDGGRHRSTRGRAAPDFDLQSLIFDPLQPQGFAFSNAVRLRVLP